MFGVFKKYICFSVGGIFADLNRNWEDAAEQARADGHQNEMFFVLGDKTEYIHVPLAKFDDNIQSLTRIFEKLCEVHQLEAEDLSRSIWRFYEEWKEAGC